MSTPKIRIALAGLGFGAEFIPLYQAHPNAEIVAICQRNPEKLKAIGDRFPRSGAVAMSIMGGIGMLSAGLL